MTGEMHINPAWLTDDVVATAAAVWGGDLQSAPVLAEALEDAGCVDADLLADLRSPERWVGWWRNTPRYQTICDMAHATEYFVAGCRIASGHSRIAARWARQEIEAARRAREAADAARLAEVHAVVTAETVARLEREAAACHASRDVSGGYRRRQLIEAIRRPGYIAAAYRDLRGTPPPGHVWIRGATGGKWSRPRAEKRGRPLTLAELEKMVSPDALPAACRERVESGD